MSQGKKGASKQKSGEQRQVKAALQKRYKQTNAVGWSIKTLNPTTHRRENRRLTSKNNSSLPPQCHTLNVHRSNANGKPIAQMNGKRSSPSLMWTTKHIGNQNKNQSDTFPGEHKRRTVIPSTRNPKMQQHRRLYPRPHMRKGSLVWIHATFEYSSP